MQGTGRTPVQTRQEREREDSGRQKAKDNKRETRRSLMTVVAQATDVVVKMAPVSKLGQLPERRLEYHEKIRSGVKRDD